MKTDSPVPSSRSGFTLIELLVVIAIIAILAAILFPVFAKVREKARQAACMSNMKQDSLGILQYVQDNDEMYPQAEILSGGSWIISLFTTPSTLRPGNTALRNCYWSNAIQPYIKSVNTYSCPSSIPWLAGAAPVNGAVPITYTYNGYLQFSNESAVLAPADVIMVWPGNAKTAFLGYAFSNPVLDCNNPNATCKYTPATVQATATTAATCGTGDGSSDGNGPNFGGIYIQFGTGYVAPSYNTWVHGNGDNFCFADGHVKWAPLSGDPNVDPWVPANANGDMFDPNTGAGSYYWDGCHATLFRPDNVE